MKSKILMIMVVVGVVCLVAASAILTRKLFHMQIQPASSLKIDQSSAVSPQTPANAPITASAVTEEKNQGKAGKPATVAQNAAGQPPKQQDNSSSTKNATEEIIEPAGNSSLAKSEGKAPLPNIDAGNSAQPPKQQDGSGSTDVVGKVIRLSGTATIVGADGNMRLLKINADICKMDKIETGANTKLEIKFIDDTVVSPGEKSTIIIEECLYSPANPAKCSFAFRFVRGVCRLLTGHIAHINPDNFKVKTKLATMGIRGCDLVFKNTPVKNSIYVLDVGQSKSIEVDTTVNGTDVIDINTGKELGVDPSVQRHISIKEPQTAVTVTEGQGAEQFSFGKDEERSLITETSHLTPARYELQQKANGATLRITPAAPPASNQTEE